MRLAAGAAFAGTIAALAWRAKALSRGGALAAFGVGTLTYAAGGWAFTLVLLAFFVPSVALSRLGRARKRMLVDTAKGGARDLWQVLANGGVATLCAVAAGKRLSPAWVAAFGGSYAAATADTWGTEIGTLVRGSPRSILSLRPIAAGLSGGVTFAGSAAEAAGAVWIGAAAAACSTLLDRSRDIAWTRTPPPALVVPVSLGGLAGALVDSILGATLQELRWCAACNRNGETNPHVCGAPTRRVRGLPGFTNDVVNFAATATGAAVAFIAARRTH